MRKNYTGLDMIRMARFAKENPELKPIPLIKAYDKEFPELSARERYENVVRFFKENGIELPT